jgi:radical SAM protein with 4Fe4S-binding SPASM domain
MENGWDHSIVPVHYCGNAEHEDQEAGIHSPHVFVLYHLLARIDKEMFGVEWKPHAAFPYDKTCNRARGAGLHIRANGDVTSCSESPPKEVTPRYTFGNVLNDSKFSLVELVRSARMQQYRKEFNQGHGVYVCSPERCDLYAEDLCGGGCAVRSAYSRVDYNTGFIVKNNNPNSFSDRREDPLCPAWTVLALNQGILKPGLLETIHERLLERSKSINSKNFPFIQPVV